MVLGLGYELLLALGSLSRIEQCTAILIKQTYILFIFVIESS